MAKKRVLSGIRASGRPHLGNYLGMIKGMIALQENPKYEVFYMVADLHAITTPFKPEDLKKDSRDVVLDYLAAGVDPQKASIFIQSHVPEHIEFAYLLSSEISIARLSHLPTYKDKVKLYPQSNTMALLYYPVLMAADILIYKTEKLPVGDDQLPHLEVAREIARKMNEKYGLNFPEPEQIKTEGHSVPSLTGEGKMSKSVEGSYILLTDDLETIKRRLAVAPTDSGKGDKVPQEGGVANLLKLVELIQGKERKEGYEQDYLNEGIRYKELKNELAEAIYELLKPLQEQRRIFENDPSQVERILKEGAEKTKKVARETLGETKKAMGLV